MLLRPGGRGAGGRGAGGGTVWVCVFLCAMAVLLLRRVAHDAACAELTQRAVKLKVYFTLDIF